MNKKIRVGILFGGKSAEHEVSLLSAKNIYDALDREKYEPVLIGIDKSGRWLFPNSTGLPGNAGTGQSGFLLNADDPKNISLNTSSDNIVLAPESRGSIANLSNTASNTGSGMAVDVVFPILHGPFGEDGTVQGLLKLADIPFVGAGVLASSVGMDKDVMKRLLRDAGLPIGKFRSVSLGEKLPAFDEVSGELGLPLFIKPANMGSSVGVSKVSTKEAYDSAIKEAFIYDNKVIIEEFIPGRELECSVLGSSFTAWDDTSLEGHGIRASAVGEIIPSHEFYSYDAKYLDDNGAALVIPAEIPAETSSLIQKLSVQVFKTLCCDGLARVDFFLGKNGSPIVNEINTMPGFTRISMYPKLWEASGISYSVLIDRLIEIAILRFNKEKLLKTER